VLRLCGAGMVVESKFSILEEEQIDELLNLRRVHSLITGCARFSFVKIILYNIKRQFKTIKV
jgi:hypothetical protein